MRTLPVDGDIEVTVASLRARVQWDNARSGGSLGLGLATPLAVRPRSGPALSVRLTGRSAAGLAAAMICRGAAAPPRGENDMDQPERISSVMPKVAQSDEMVRTFTAAATGQGVVGAATTAGDRTAVPLIETMFAGGYGGGGGSEGEKGDIGAGGGGGGFARSRTVAILELAPDGVRVRPVIDQTAVILAGLGAAVGVLGVLRRGRRRH